MAMTINSLIDLVFQREQTFGTLHTPPGSSKPSQEGNDFRYCQNVLERWVTSEARNNEESMSARVFRFDLARVFSGGPQSLEEESQRLRRYLLRVYEDEEDISMSEPSVGESIKPLNTVAMDSDEDRNPRSLLFIAHGLGSWIVKSVLASESSRNIGFRRIVVINIDGLDPNPSVDIDGFYCQYLLNLRKRLHIHSPNEGVGEADHKPHMYSLLHQIDNKFRRHEHRYQKESRIPIDQKALALWLSEDDTSDFKPPSWTDWIFPSTHENNSLPPNALDKLKLSSILSVSGDVSLVWPASDSSSSSEDSDTEAPDDDRALPSKHAPERLKEWVRNERSERNINPDSTGDIASMLSVPPPYIVQSQTDDLSQIFDLALSFFKRSDLRNADRLFSLYYEQMPKEKPADIKELQIRIQIIAVEIYLGRYNGVRKKLQKIKSLIKKAMVEDANRSSKWEELHHDRRRWKATYLMRIGHWYDAARRLEKLDKHPSMRSRGEIQRDLALAYAYLGFYDKAKCTVQLANALIASTKKEGTRIASAEISLLAGDYKLALEEASTALQRMSNKLQSTHYKILTAANIKAWCLAHNAKYAEAESLCLVTVEKITKELSRKHPLCLEAMQILVYVFRCQARFAEAIGTGQALCDLATQELTDKHPLTLRSKYHLAAAHLDNGDYATAEGILEEVKRHADDPESLGWFHPESLQYRSELAYAYFCSGRTAKARDLALETAIHQVQLYRNQRQTEDGIKELRSMTCARDQVDVNGRLEYILEQVKESWQSGSGVYLHPFLVSTLQILAKIETSSHQDNVPGNQLHLIEQLLRFLTALVDANHQQSVQTTPLKFSLALVLKELGNSDDKNNLQEAISLLEQVVEDRRKLLGDSHLDTLRAYRELMIASCMRGLQNLNRGEPSNISLEEVEDRSREILESLEASLGEYHPETLQSQLWYLTVTLLKSSDNASEENAAEESSMNAVVYTQAKDVVMKVQVPPVRQERLIESLRIERMMAGLLLGSDFRDPGLLDILNGAIDQVKHSISAKSNDSMRPELEALQISLKDMLVSYLQQIGSDGIS